MFSISDIFEKLRDIFEKQIEWLYAGDSKVTKEELEEAKKILERWDKRQREKTTLHILKQQETVPEEKNITCCFFGAKEIPPEKEKKIKRLIKRQIKRAMRKGYTVFLSGFEKGGDLLAAETVMALQKKGHEIILKAYLPYKGEIVKKAMEYCQQTWVVEEYNTKGCYQQRDHYMMEHSSFLIEIIDQREQDEATYTLNYAQKRNLQICKIYF